MKPRFRRLASTALQSVFVASSITGFALAADQTWTGATSTLWSASGNWSSATPGASDVAVFDTASTANLATILNANTSLQGIKVLAPSGPVTVATKLTAEAVTANSTTDIITYVTAPATPLATGDIITLGGTTIPTGLTNIVQYFVVNATATTFQVATTSGGTPINFTTNGAALNVTGGPATTLTLGASGIDLSGAAQNLTLTTPLALSLSTNQTFDVAGGRNLTVNGGIGGTGGLTKNGSGTLTLWNLSNTFSGGATLNAGVVAIGTGTAGSAGNLGVAGSTITLAGGTITNGTGGSNGTITLNNNFVVNADSTINMGNRMVLGNNTTSRSITGNAKLTLNLNTTVARDDIYANCNSFTGTFAFTGSGLVRLFINGGFFTGMSGAAVELNGSAVLNPQTNSGGNGLGIGSLAGTSATAALGASSAGTPNYTIGGLGTSTTYAGGITGNAAITKVGAGTLTLTNTTTITHTGGTTVNEGTLKYNGTKTGVGVVTVNSGGTLAGTGSLAGTTTVASGGILSPGDAGVGTITHSSLSLASGGVLDLEFGSGNDQITVATGGTLALSTGVKVNLYDGAVGSPTLATNGTYTLINTTGATVTGFNSSSFEVQNPVSGKSYTFANTGTAITVTVGDFVVDPSNYWNVDGGGSWNTASNWTKGTVPNAIGANAKFGPGIGGAGGSFSNITMTIPLDGAQTVGELLINEDFGSSFIIAPGTGGSLLLDNGAGPSSVSVVAGDHRIEAPVAVDPDDVSIDVAGIFNFEVSGVLSSSAPGGGITKSGSGTLLLSGANTYDGGSILAGGVVAVNSSSSLGSSDASFFGGSIRLLADLADSRPYKVSGANSATFDTNAFNYALTGAITSLPSATGGLVKNGAGTLSLGAVNAYTGATNINAGVVDVVTGGAIATSAVNIANAGSARLVVSGGGATVSGATTVSNGSSGILVSGGSASFNAITATNNSNANHLIAATGGSFSASSIAMGRSALVIGTPTAGATGTGFYVNGATSSVTGNLSVGAASTSVNSTASARIDSGSLTVGGVVLVTISSPDRWSVLDVNGGIFTSTNSATGVQVGSTVIGSSAFLVRNGTATVERILLTQPATSTETSMLNVSGGSLYIGAGGIVGNVNAGTGILDVQLGTATLGAKANWTSSVAATLTGTTTIKAASELNVAANITLSGAIGGVGGFDKTGAGTLTLSGTNTYAGNTNVNEGTLAISGDQSASLGTVAVASGATLAGTGSIGGSVSIASGGRQAFALAATAGAQTTRQITGALSMDSGSVIDLTAAGTVANGVYVLATAAGGITGLPGTVNLPEGVPGTLSVSENSLVLTVGSSGYASWASTNGLTSGVNDGPTQDPDADGVENLLEFVLGGLPLTPNTGILPTLNASGTDFVFTFNRSDESEAEVTLTFQHSPDLATWTPVAVGASSNLPTVSVAENGAAADTITVTVPKGSNTKLFGRIQGTK